MLAGRIDRTGHDDSLICEAKRPPVAGDGHLRAKTRIWGSGECFWQVALLYPWVAGLFENPDLMVERARWRRTMYLVVGNES